MKRSNSFAQLTDAGLSTQSEAQMEASNWNSLPSTKAVAVIQNLQPGTLYYCRVAAVGAKEQLVYSDVVSRIAA